METKLEEFSFECLKNTTNNTECLEDGSWIIILRSKKIENGNNKPIRVVLERPSKRISQHLKPLYINAHFDGLPIDRVLVDGDSTINVMPQIML